MANYMCAIRTNYFHVTNEEKYRKLCEGLMGPDEVYFFEEMDNKGKPMFGFGSYDYISWCNGEDNADGFDVFLDRLSGLLPEDDACIVMEAGHEKLRYVSGICTIVTNKGIDYVSLTEAAIGKARDMLNNPGYDTRVDY